MSEKQKPLDPADTPWFTTKIPAAATTFSERRREAEEMVRKHAIEKAAKARRRKKYKDKAELLLGGSTFTNKDIGIVIKLMVWANEAD